MTKHEKEIHMAKVINHLVNQLGEKVINGLNESSGVSHNRYTLTIDALSSPISILQVNGDEQLNQPWHYTITFTSSDKAISLDTVLNQTALLTFNPVMNNSLMSAISSLSALPVASQSRKLHGVITAFSQLSVNQDEAHYQVVLSSRLALVIVRYIKIKV